MRRARRVRRTAPPAALTDADMPPVDSLGADSDYTGFLSPKISEPLRRAALRKLFHSAEFNVIDELDDYAEDFTTFTALGDLVTADMRHPLEVEAKKQAEALQQARMAQEPRGGRTRSNKAITTRIRRPRSMPAWHKTPRRTGAEDEPVITEAEKTDA